ncbi:unnamed protein product, partial [Rotaria socialis]
MSNKRNIKRCSRKTTSTRTPPKKRIEISSLQLKNISTAQTTTSNLTTSSIHTPSTSSKPDSNVPLDGYSIIQNQMLFALICKTNCEVCGSRWNGKMNINKREGLFLILSFQCSTCQNIITIETSPKIVASDRRDINVRSQIGGHLCGIRHAGLVKLMGVMNLPSPIHDERYSKWDRDLLIMVKSFTGTSMKKAVVETVAAENDTELMVSGDGFWQTRGFQSRHGAAALISCNAKPKVLDIETCSKTCNTCMGALSIKKSNPAKYDNIIRSHQCEKNYDKSSGAMESAAILIMFKRSG